MQMHDNLAGGSLYAFDTGGMNLKLSGELRASDLRVDIRCDAVAEDIPSGGVPLSEGKPLLPREMAPDPLGGGAYFIHDDGRISIPFMQ
jgi:hypothetical protein